MRKSGKRRVNYGMKPKVPMLVARGLIENTIEVKERFAVDAFVRGFATKEHYFLLQDVLNLLLIAGGSSGDRKYALDRAESIYKPVMISIEERYNRTGKLGCNAAEIKALRNMINFNREFWMRQPAELFAVCHAETKAFYQEQHKNRQAA
jgi:hypothetical protein